MKKVVLSLVLLFVGFIAFAQVGFEEKEVNHAEVSSPTSVFSADLDGDGYIDILTSSRNDDKIAWYRNIDGTGVFGEQRIISLDNDKATSVYAVDIDNDGDIDVFSTSNNKLAWYENIDGTGTFGNEQIISSEIGNRTSVISVDIDGDGDLDIVSVLNRGYLIDNIIDWYENTNGLGNFGLQQIIVSDSEEIGNVSVTDINRDGYLDIIFGTLNGNIKLYKRIDGSNTFETELLIYSESSYGYFGSIQALDVDNDGYMELVFGGVNTIMLLEYVEDSDTYSTSVIMNERAVHIKSADIDGDGFVDLIKSAENEISWIKNLNGTGNFGNKQVVTTDVISVEGIDLADFDGDGDMDVTSASNYYNRIAWYENINGLGVFGSQNILSNESLKLVTSQYTADLDGDGDMDIVASSQEGKLVWYKNLDGFGSFSDEQIISMPWIGSGISEEVTCVDMDGDGDMDIVYAGNSKLVWYENTNGLGDFVFNQVITEDSAKSVACADIDSDGDIDIVCGLESGKKWYRNVNGLGSFEEGQVIYATGNSPEVCVSDIDNDGDIDVLFNSGVWYKNTDGLGTFEAQVNICSGISLFTSDIDNDGDEDVFSTSEDQTYWRENIDGQGNFSDKIIIDNHDFYYMKNRSIYVADVDVDGDEDVVISSSDGIFWYENMDGQGTFGIQQVIKESDSFEYANSLKAADIDGDDKYDFVSVFSVFSKISWFKNLGNVKNEINGTVSMTLSDDCSSSESIIPNLMITTENDTESISTFSNSNGLYQLFPDIGSYITSVTSALPNYFISSPLNYLHDFTEIGSTETANFCIMPNGDVDDLNISIIPLDNARPGFDSLYVIVYKNVGTTQLSGNVNFEYDNSKLNLQLASETITSQTANSVTFDYSNLNPFESRVIGLYFNVLAPPTVNIGDVLDFTATINPVASDETPDDNVYELHQTVVGSYDPNDIAVAEGEQILLEDADKYLHYVIRFQNTGTAHAVKVRVHNILDDKLDWTTLQLESSSHDNTVEIKNGSEIDFIFNAIYLPDSTSDEPNSHGYIAYKIKPKDNVSVGDVFVNNADIYFDFNTAINTNTVTTEIVNTLSLNDNSLLNFTVYPIPTSDVLKINTKSQISKIEIYNKLGQLVLEENNKNDIDISNLNQGIYFIKLTDINNNSNTKKIVKK